MANHLFAFTLFCITAAFAPTLAQATEPTIFSFDGLNPPQAMPSEYGGFHWTNWYLHSKDDPSVNMNAFGPQTDAVSNILDMYGTSTIRSDTPFNFLAASYQSDVWYAGSRAIATGYRDGYKLYEEEIYTAGSIWGPTEWPHNYYAIDTVTFKSKEPVQSKFAMSLIKYSYPDPNNTGYIYNLQAPPINLSNLSSYSSPGPGPSIPGSSANSTTAGGSQALDTSQSGAQTGSQSSSSSGGTQTVSIQAPQINLQTLPTLGKR